VKHAQGAGVRGAVADVAVFKESELEGNMVTTDIGEKEGSVD
tara:strand:- start:110 stop:235 length:126 start_codon:yes stop_codon:yes gene_type:complete